MLDGMSKKLNVGRVQMHKKVTKNRDAWKVMTANAGQLIDWYLNS